MAWRQPSGLAGGKGVLVDTLKGDEPERFYGVIEQWRIKVGGLQNSGGYTAGNWDHGGPAVALPDDVAQRNVVLGAFRAAALAAASVSKALARKDAPSSRFYAKQARQLREQMH